MATVSFRIDDEIKDRLEKIARDQGKAISDLFREAIVDRLDRHEAEEDEGRINLSVKERLSLFNQFETLGLLKPDRAEDYRLMKDVVQQGYQYEYRKLMNPIYSELPEKDCIEVIETLGMFEDFAWTYQNKDTRGDLKETDIAFPGFDGNHEISRLSYARFLLSDVDRFSQMKPFMNKSLNSHMRTVALYRRMLSAYEPIRNRYPGPQPLSPSDIRSIKEAAKGR